MQVNWERQFSANGLHKLEKENDDQYGQLHLYPHQERAVRMIKDVENQTSCKVQVLSQKEYLKVKMLRSGLATEEKSHLLPRTRIEPKRQLKVGDGFFFLAPRKATPAINRLERSQSLLIRRSQEQVRQALKKNSISVLIMPPVEELEDLLRRIENPWRFSASQFS